MFIQDADWLWCLSACLNYCIVKVYRKMDGICFASLMERTMGIMKAAWKKRRSIYGMKARFTTPTINSLIRFPNDPSKTIIVWSDISTYLPIPREKRTSGAPEAMKWPFLGCPKSVIIMCQTDLVRDIKEEINSKKHFWKDLSKCFILLELWSY